MALTMPTAFQFGLCKNWIRDRTNELSALGYPIEVIENTKQTATIAVKISSPRILADLVVWEHGACSMQAFDLKKDSFVLEIHDADLNFGDPFEKMGAFLI
jgi:hypothetical protein